MKTNHWKYEIVSKNPIAYLWHWEGDIKKVRIVNCDFDKRVDMVCEDTGEEFSYKWGYVYNTYEDAALNRDFDYDAYVEGNISLETPDCIDPWKMLLSNKDYASYKKVKRKQYHSANEWFVATDDDSYSTSKKFPSFKKAGRYFDQLKHEDFEFIGLGENNYLDCNLLEWDRDNDQLWTIDHGRKKNHNGAKYRMIKSRYLGKNPTYKEWRK